MKNYLIIISLFCVFATAKAAENPPSVSAENISVSNPLENEDGFLEIIKIVKTETTKREWQLFCDITSYPFAPQFDFLGENDKVVLSWDEALLCATWLISQEKESDFLSEILQEIDECPAPTPRKIVDLCLAVRDPVRDTAEDSIGYNYHRALWNLACAVPKVDSTATGRAKVKAYWDKYKKDIRCPETGQEASDDLNITKYAVDSVNIRFTRELAVAYKLDFNFVDEKDGLTLLDYIQVQLDYAKTLTPPPNIRIKEYEAVYDAVVRAGGKHAKDLTPEELGQ